MDIEKIEELIQVLEKSRTLELTVRQGESAVHMRKAKKVKSASEGAKKKKQQAAEVVVDTDAFITAPVVGLFHINDAVKKPGVSVTKGQLVGTIESMKLHNDVYAEVAGVIAEVLVEHEAPVEYGQSLLRIEKE